MDNLARAPRAAKRSAGKARRRANSRSAIGPRSNAERSGPAEMQRRSNAVGGLSTGCHGVTVAARRWGWREDRGWPRGPPTTPMPDWLRRLGAEPGQLARATRGIRPTIAFSAHVPQSDIQPWAGGAGKRSPQHSAQVSRKVPGSARSPPSQGSRLTADPRQPPINPVEHGASKPGGTT